MVIRPQEVVVFRRERGRRHGEFNDSAVNLATLANANPWRFHRDTGKVDPWPPGGHVPASIPLSTPVVEASRRNRTARSMSESNLDEGTVAGARCSAEHSAERVRGRRLRAFQPSRTAAHHAAGRGSSRCPRPAAMSTRACANPSGTRALRPETHAPPFPRVDGGGMAVRTADGETP